MCATALSGVQGDAVSAFQEALALPGAASSPFDAARIHLYLGEHLSRGRAGGPTAREHLSMARTTFRRLEAAPWEARASAGLRAAGAALSGASDVAQLSPVELQIAELAASGLTNKEIGARLFLSHRTVGARLYHIFPKLGISTRAALRDALAALEGDGAESSR